MKIIWSTLAIERVTEIARYIARDNVSAAEKWVHKIFEKVKQLEFAPASGRIIPEIRHNDFRELIYGNYRIIYRAGKEQISILTVRHGRQVLPIDEILSDIDNSNSLDDH